MNRGELKSEAKAALKSHLLQLIIVGGCVTVIAFLIAILGNIVSGVLVGIAKAVFKKGAIVELMAAVSSVLLACVSLCVSAVTSIGMVRASQAALEDDNPGLGNITSIFSDGSLPLAMKTFLWMYVWVMLWSLLFIIPGIIKAYSYSMVPFILAENPDMEPKEVLKMSSEMMKGHKFEIFILALSFIGWGFLAALCCGLGYIVLTPYMMLTFTVFYNRLSADYR